VTRAVKEPVEDARDSALPRCTAGWSGWHRFGPSGHTDLKGSGSSVHYVPAKDCGPSDRRVV